MIQHQTPALFSLEPSWQRALEEELRRPYLAGLRAFVERERALGDPVYPPAHLVFNALRSTPFEKVSVVIVGQDPYHGPGQAHGLSFSVPRGIPPPPSLKNIFKELHDDLGVKEPSHGCLLHWALQGVLLLNSTLTVRHKNPMSHAGRGWEHFTDAILEAIAQRPQPAVFVLWGKHAQEKCDRLPSLQENRQHRVLRASHPSPFSAQRGFFGCKHFSQINAQLKAWGREEIDWSLPE